MVSTIYVCRPSTSYFDTIRCSVASSGENRARARAQSKQDAGDTTISTDHMAKSFLRTEDPRFRRSLAEHVVRALVMSLGPLSLDSRRKCI